MHWRIPCTNYSVLTGKRPRKTSTNCDMCWGLGSIVKHTAEREEKQNGTFRNTCASSGIWWEKPPQLHSSFGRSKKASWFQMFFFGGKSATPKTFGRNLPPSWLKRNNMFVLKGWLTKKKQEMNGKALPETCSSKQAMACFFRVFPGWQVWFRRILAPDASSQGHKSGFFWEGFGVWPNCRISGCKCGDLVGERKTPKKLPWDFG